MDFCIEYINTAISNVLNRDVMQMGIFDRMFRIGILSYISSLNEELEKLNKSLDESINLEGVCIDFDKYLSKKAWNNNWIFWDKGERVSSKYNNKSINVMTDYFPIGKDEYKETTKDAVKTFKTSLNIVSGDEYISSRALYYSIDAAVNRMLNILSEIQKKVKNPKSHLYIKLWEDILERFDNDEFDKDYKEWKYEYGSRSYEELKVRHKQEVFKFLKTDFFRFCQRPTGSEVKNCSYIITEDDLPLGTLIPENNTERCTIFQKFFEWKDDIMILNYEKIAQYIYKNYHQFDELEFFNITDFDRILESIHEDMAKQKPNLAKYLKRYEENIINELIKDCSKIINTCIVHLTNGTRNTFLREYLCRLLSDKEMKEEAKKALTSQSRNTYICEIIAALKWYNVFKANVNSGDLADSLSKEMTTVRKPSIKKYIDTATNSRESLLFNWTSKIIEDLKANPYNPFSGL